MIKEISGLQNLCIKERAFSTCYHIDLDKATKMCGKTYTPNIYYNITFNGVADQFCDGNRCHLEVATDNSDFHAGVDCFEKSGGGGVATCTCIIYAKE